MSFLNLIEAKRDGHALTPAQIQRAIGDCTAGRVPDYQMAALLMAIYLRGMTGEETRTLTLAMRDSGEVLRFPDDPRPLVDKHSTGGVGDKVSLVLAPLLACLGFRVPMISGRGLGITGGTLDKLDSIPGLQTTLPAQRIVEMVQEVGCVICGQTDEMAPADKKLYALRDVTGTVGSIPLITASILSKKLAECLAALVLDVKFGAAAFMRTPEQARALVQAMVALGNESGVSTRALLTRMDTPVGRAAGNWLEVREAITCLEGRGPADLEHLVIECAAHLLMQTRRPASLDESRAQARACLAAGQPREKWNQMLAAQGADLKAFHERLALDHTAPAVIRCRAEGAGFVTCCDARLIGEIVRDLGGGRLTKEAAIDPRAGVDQLAKPGEAVELGSILGRVHAPDERSGQAACARLRRAFALDTTSPAVLPLIAEVLG
ncbi:MAG: thymidine phosphorylase [Verrucomicrobia bacterium]|nr:thymidine phosphorylase [Verrucomicrobiota bacterium]